MKLNGTRVREILKERGMNITDLAKRTGMPLYDVEEYVSERHNCPKKKLHQISDVLDVDWLEIVKFRGSFY